MALATAAMLLVAAALTAFAVGPPPAEEASIAPITSIDRASGRLDRVAHAIPDEAAIGLLGALLLGIAAAVRKAANGR